MVKNTLKLNNLKGVDDKLFEYCLTLVCEGHNGKPVTLGEMDPALYRKAVDFTKEIGISVSDLVNYLLEDYFYGVDELEEK